MATIVVVAGAAVFDIAEILHQVDVSEASLTALAIAVAVLHVSAVGAAMAGWRPTRMGRASVSARYLHQMLRSIGLFVIAAIAEIGVAWLVWQALREGGWWFAGIVVLALSFYGFVATFQPDANFGNILVPNGGIFVASSLLWGMLLDRFRRDRFVVIRPGVGFVGVSPITYTPDRSRG